VIGSGAFDRDLRRHWSSSIFIAGLERSARLSP